MEHNSLQEEQTFSLFFDTYKEQVYGYVLAIVKQRGVAEELTQDIFIKLWTCRDILNEIRNIDRYIFILSRNRALNHLRRIKYDQRALEELRYHISEGHYAVEEYLLAQDYQQLLADALHSLSSQRRLVYKLSREEGLSMNEIAERLQLSPNTIKNHLVAALKGIRQHLERHGDISLVLTFFMLI